MSREPPAPHVVDAVSRAAGRAPSGWARVVAGGYTPAERWVVDFDDGLRAFAKVGTIDRIADWLRIEHRAYSEIRGAFMPTMLGWSDGPAPALLLEDLSDAHWPPPWTRGLVERTLEALDAVASAACPDWTTPVEAQTEIFSGWTQVAADPDPFLELGLVSRRWLESSLPILIAHENPPDLTGSALLHFDVRSDNICFTLDRAMLVDWNHVKRGNPLFDVAAWLPSLYVEGGPAPEEVNAEAGVFAAAIAGYFCARAPQPTIPDAPRVRHVQLEQARASLPWAARWLELPEPDGPASPRRG